MRYGQTTISSAKTFGTAVLTAALLGCMQATPTAGVAPSNSGSSMQRAGAFLNAIGSRSMALFENETVSLALDRIDQRDLPLDHTYRRTGTGQGVVVYVFDGGVMHTHPELAGRVRKGYDAFPNDPRVCNAHGTAVAGAVAGSTLGVAPGAEIVDVKMVECGKLRGTIRAIVEGARWTIQDAKRHGRPAVANWSFIADTTSTIPALDSAIADLRRAGIPVVVSAGNLDINACKVSPGNADGSIVVGASAVTRSKEAGIVDVRSPNTAYGPCVDLYAPGDSVLLPSFDQAQTPSVQLWNGTSMSAGYVSGAAALYLERNPAARPDDVLKALRASATQNVVRDSHAPLSWLLYVGADNPRRTLAQADAREGQDLLAKRARRQ
jgi:subtilisin family serine protease